MRTPRVDHVLAHNACARVGLIGFVDNGHLVATVHGLGEVVAGAPRRRHASVRCAVVVLEPSRGAAGIARHLIVSAPGCTIADSRNKQQHNEHRMQTRRHRDATA